MRLTNLLEKEREGKPKTVEESVSNVKDAVVALRIRVDDTHTQVLGRIGALETSLAQIYRAINGLRGAVAPPTTPATPVGDSCQPVVQKRPFTQKRRNTASRGAMACAMAGAGGQDRLEAATEAAGPSSTDLERREMKEQKSMASMSSPFDA